MSYSKSKHFVKSRLTEEHSLEASSSDFERDDDDPLSIKSLSITIMGITIAFLTILVPSISVLIGNPISQENEIIFNQSLKIDGS